jgi:heme oxygenase
MTAFFGQLVMRTDEARRAFETQPNVVDALARGLSVERYRSLLLELYHVVWHFNPVSAAAASRLDDGLRDVRYFLYGHMHEEQGHEQWVLDDLDAVGVPRAQALAHAPLPHTLALVGYNYWAAERRHPASVLGMLYVLEVIASVYGGAFASAVQESLLLDGQRGVSFLASHAGLDMQHMATLREVLDGVHDEAAREAVVESARVNFHHFTALVGQL